MIDHPENEERIHHEIRSLRARIAELEGALNPSGPGREPDRRGDEYFHRFFQAIPHPIYVVDVSTHSIVLANAAADRSDEAAVGTCHKLIHRNEAPCSDGEAFCPLEEVRRTGRAAMVEHVHYDGQGRQRYVEINAFPVFDEAGRLVQMIEWCRDTTRERAAQKEQADRRDRLEEQVRERTEALEASNRDLRAEIEERKRIEERLRQSELWMRSTFDSLDDAALIVTPDRRLAGINQAAHDMFGYTFEELSLHSTSLLHVGEAHFQEFGRRIQEAFGQGRTARFEFEARRRNGEVFPTEHTVTLLKDRQGEAIGILSVVRDITERKRNEEILQKSQASLARAQEIAHLGNWDWDLGSGALTWSDEIYRIFGLQPGAFGATYEEFVAAIHPDDRDDLQRAVDEAVYQGRVYSVEHRVVRPDGTVRAVREIGEVTRDSAGRPVHMLGTVQDITEIKQAEDELARYREHLEELIRERTS
ncbi:MAG: PAS domain S-box protein, partial [Proteobacteria bacterium]|nr:PAS domain S-box protein [Pseudomonadota bacterium]